MNNSLPAVRVEIVTDLGFGDSGKGITVDFLCSRRDPKDTIVIRTSSGHQCGHTVELNGYRHMISNFGAGTLRGIPTYYTQNTTMFPPALALEREELQSHKITPQVYFHPLAMVTTPYDIAWNHFTERSNLHGSCGVGYGATIVRNIAGIGLAVKDISNEWVFKQKLQAIREWYREKFTDGYLWETYFGAIDDQAFISSCAFASRYWRTQIFSKIQGDYSTWIFEGNQGILLDKFEGIYPHNTWATCTSEAALEFLSTIHDREIESINIYYVTRCYQTRHGNGPMSSKQEVQLVNNEAESNTPNEWQGTMRARELDLNLMDWALRTDRMYVEKFRDDCEYNLVITCLDQRPEISAKHLVDRIYRRDHFATVYGSYSPESKDFRLIY